MITVTIYTDGACNVHDPLQPGGYGVILISGSHQKELSGGENMTTNNRMELTACIEGLKALKQPCEVTVYTDSQYVQKGITEWIHGWMQKGWKDAKGKPVKNRDLWEDLYDATKPHQITWQWVRGHAGNTYNERADRLAVAEVDKRRSKGVEHD